MIRYRQWQEQREQAADEAAYKKNPDLFHNKMEIMEAARLRLQARYDEDAIRAEEKRQEAEDRKTEQEIKDTYIKDYDKAYGPTYLVLDLLQKVFYTNNGAREAFVDMCRSEYVQDVTFQSYLYKRQALWVGDVMERELTDTSDHPHSSAT